MRLAGLPSPAALNAIQEHSAMSKFQCDNPIPFYVYKITCRSTGQYYFGYRKRHVRKNRQPEDDLWIHYYTSSTDIKRLIDRYSRNDFDAAIVFKGFDADDCFWVEQDLIKTNLADPLCINKTYHDRDKGHKVFVASSQPCDYCQKEIGSGNILKHQVACKSNPNRVSKTRDRFPCKYCGELRIPGSLTSHERSCAANPCPVKNINKKAGTGQCQFCSQHFNLIGLKKHERKCDFNLEWTTKTFKCVQCEQTIASRKRSKHTKSCVGVIRLLGSRQYKLPCRFCKKLIGSCAIERHQNNCIQNPDRVQKTFGKVPCIFCNRLIGEIVIKNHMAACRSNPSHVSRKSKRGTCNHCSASFGMHVLQRHIISCLKRQGR